MQPIETFAAERLRRLSEPSASAWDRLRTSRVLVAGLGNIGSQFVVQVAPLVGSLVLVDRDRVDFARNRFNQAYSDAADDGRPKAEAAADLVRRIAPWVEIEVWTGDLAEAPLGLFDDVDVVCGALDSLRARQALICERAWPLGKTVIDGGVGRPLVGRVHVFRPGPTTACPECSWSPAHYRQIARETPCLPGTGDRAPPTPSPTFLGAAVASLMAAEVVNHFCDRGGDASRETLVSYAQRRFQSVAMRRSPGCRFDHTVVADRMTLPVEFERASLGDLRAVVARRWGRTDDVRLELDRGFGSAGLFGDRKTLSLADAARRAATSLAEAGFDRRDLVRVRAAAGLGGWVRFTSPNQS